MVWAFAAALAASLLLTRVVELSARRFGLYRRISPRDAHASPTPRLGGVAIAIAMFIGFSVSGPPIDPSQWVVIVGATALVALGALDDIVPLPALGKLVVQVAVASATAVVLQPTIEVDLGVASFHLGGAAAAGVAVLWIVGLINVVNFMDGIDGIAAGVAAAAVPGLLLVLGGGGSSELLIVLAAACLGFLAWNHHPASIFMGDAGSYLIGYVGATAVFLGDRQPAPIVPAVIVFSPFILDVALTLIRRAWSRRDLLMAHSEHLFQLLVRRGHRQRDVMIGYVLLTALTGLAAAAYVGGNALVKLAVVVGTAGLAVAHVALYRHVGPLGRSAAASQTDG